MTKSLTQILKTLPKTSTHLPNQTGLKPHLGEKGAKAWLAKHPVLDKGEPYDNDHLANVKAFDKGANRFGHDNVEFNDVNDKWGLSTSTVATEEKKYLRDIVENYSNVVKGISDLTKGIANYKEKIMGNKKNKSLKQMAAQRYQRRKNQGK